ncbi:hypothetical protein [Nereida sp. MMG025]|uniref:hypothetical protein n=1 Tax=Nereida sp. MMG025 TaxID=2909981 RepID=UPI001F264778|nr:hypothetical protein [Nereida sp. MMG025]MCF6443699.1 hypothetical protein [Nereida sp. MMG025]
MENGFPFEWLIAAGAIITLIGVIGIFMFISKVRKAARAGLDDDALKARLSQLMPLNLGAFFISAIGLMMVVAGVILG